MTTETPIDFNYAPFEKTVESLRNEISSRYERQEACDDIVATLAALIVTGRNDMPYPGQNVKAGITVALYETIAMSAIGYAASLDGAPYTKVESFVAAKTGKKIYFS